jgi:hypothetical protein
MNEHRQVKLFDNYTGDTTKECNEFLKTLGGRVISINSFYNTIMGGTTYVVEYWC